MASPDPVVPRCARLQHLEKERDGHSDEGDANDRHLQISKESEADYEERPEALHRQHGQQQSEAKCRQNCASHLQAVGEPSRQGGDDALDGASAEPDGQEHRDRTRQSPRDLAE
jgi:hypothetical protein